MWASLLNEATGTDMPRVYVGIGSNINREESIRGGIKALREVFSPLQLSTVYESKAYGFEGDNFYNLVAGFDTEMSLEELGETLKDIESALGRERQEERFLPRTLDIDLLLYGDHVQHNETIDLPREDIELYAFVLKPLAEIAGNRRHPETGERFADLWAAFDDQNQSLWPVNLSLPESDKP